MKIIKKMVVYLSVLTWLDVDAYVFHNGDVQLMKYTYDNTLTSRRAGSIIKGLNIH